MLRSLALDALLCSTVDSKLAAVQALDMRAAVDPDAILLPPAGAMLPGRPARPELVHPRALPRRGLKTAQDRAVLLHALAHIEFNAIDLALDIVWRFAALPEDFYRQWLRIAQEEALHFSLLQQRLQALGHAYGDFSAHNGLWEMAQKTSGDVLARLGLVPRLLEARGLDVTPGLRAKLAQAGDPESAAVLDTILRDEIGHVACGNHWFHTLCAQRDLQPQACFEALARAYAAPAQRGPFNWAARRAAGFGEAELQALQVNEMLSK